MSAGNTGGTAINILSHNELIVRASAAVRAAQTQVQDDPLRPGYHFTAPAHWLNDPNGPIYFDGAYHLFYQHNPFGPEWGNMSWGHACSKDLVHWEHLPVALTPGPHSYDQDGVFSGSCVIHNGVPTILYTGVQPEVQCLAQSFDGMNTWIKESRNPVIAGPPRDDLTAFRDPFVWYEDQDWYMIVGSGIKGIGGAALLFRSHDLLEWQYLHPFCTGFGAIWECPNFLWLGGRPILIVSPEDTVRFAVGEYRNYRFIPENWKILNVGGPREFYAPNTLQDDQGRTIMWGWIQGGGSPGFPWQGMLSLPRILNLDAHDNLLQMPVPELAVLRQPGYSLARVEISNGMLPVIYGDSWEMIIEFESERIGNFLFSLNCPVIELDILTIKITDNNQRITINGHNQNFDLNDKSSLSLHIFMDRSVWEIFINHQICSTGRFYRPITGEINCILKTGNDRDYLKKYKFWPLRAADSNLNE
ncbi:MAG: glycoside hydrolase family 32 protein [Candidatus Neomarinimicrobiota bacterium]